MAYRSMLSVSALGALLVLGACSSASDDPAPLPDGELARTRRKWYDGLARTPQQRVLFARLADAGGAEPFADPRRPEAFRDERRRGIVRT